MIGFCIFYIIFSFCFVFPPSAFVASGLTVPNICGSWLGSENLQFVQYHIRRTVATIIIHSLLPLGFFVGLAVFESYVSLLTVLDSLLGLTAFAVSIFLPAYNVFHIWSWKQRGWKTHPFVLNLSRYATGGRCWTDVASEINAEFRRIDKVSISTNAVIKTIITNSWILKVEPYTVHAAHQSHVTLQLENSEQHELTANSPGGVQFLLVRVEQVRNQELLFRIRLNATDYRDVQDRLQSPINNIRGITIHQDVHERFKKVFIEEAQKNPVYRTTEELDSCLGCAVNGANTRLIRRCDSSDGQNCTPCFCRPMWCVDCLSKWFSSRQDAEHPETWLSSRCPCPTCRNPFCLLDVSLVEYTEHL